MYIHIYVYIHATSKYYFRFLLFIHIPIFILHIIHTSCLLVAPLLILFHLYSVRSYLYFLSLSRVINAGKSTLNEDQACCEVLLVKRRPTGSSTPNRTPVTRRRSSLPNGEGLGPREYQVSLTNGSGSIRG